MTCWIPSFSTIEGGNTREAKARRKIVLNSESKPPIPISSNLKLGARIAFGGALRDISLCSSLGNDVRSLLCARLQFESTGRIFHEGDVGLLHEHPRHGATSLRRIHEFHGLYALHFHLQVLSVEFEKYKLADAEHNTAVRADEVLRHLVCRESLCDFETALHEAHFDVYAAEIVWGTRERLYSDLITSKRKSNPLALQTTSPDGSWWKLAGGIVTIEHSGTQIATHREPLTEQSRGIVA